MQPPTEAGIQNLKGGTIYPLLARLEQEGLVESHWSAGIGGPRSKYFTITVAGSAALAHGSAGWTDFAFRIGSILSISNMSISNMSTSNTIGAVNEHSQRRQ